MIADAVYTDSYNRPSTLYSNDRIESPKTQALRFQTNPQFAVPAPLYSFENIKTRFEAIQKLPNNWDGMGAVVPERRVVMNAFRFLKLLTTKQLLALEPENINPTPYGTIEIDWREGRNLLSVEIGTTQIGFFTQFSDNSTFASNGFPFNGLKIDADLVAAIDKYFAV